MIDMDAYRKFHARGEDTLRQSELADNVVKSDEIPGGSFAILLPATIVGYGFHNKEWSRFDRSPAYASTERVSQLSFVLHIFETSSGTTQSSKASWFSGKTKKN